MRTLHEIYNEITEDQLKTVAIMIHDDDWKINETGYLVLKSQDENDMDFIALTDIDEYDADDYDQRFMCLTDDEADEKAKEYIEESVWAFNVDFLAGESGHDYEVFKAIQENGRCEDNNAAILLLIGDIDSFVKSAISADGRGHFLNTYDGHEHEIKIGNETFYIYRMN